MADPVASTTTVVKATQDEINQFLNVGANNILVPGEEAQKKKPTLFAPLNTESKFIDNLHPKTETDDNGAGTAGNDDLEEDLETLLIKEEDLAAKAAANPADTALAESLQKIKEAREAAEARATEALLAQDKGAGTAAAAAASAAAEEEEKKKTGRPTTTESIVKDLIEKKVFVPFEGEDDLSKYTAKDFTELFEMNIAKIKEDNLKETQMAIYEAMPPQLQYAYAYLMNGGQDISSLLKSISASQEVRDLDITNEMGQEYAVAAWLQTTNFGTPAEIQAEINGYKDRGELEKYAKLFQPKLQKVKDDKIKQQLVLQDAENNRRAQAAEQYQNHIYAILEPGELNGLKLDPKTQERLFTGLTQPAYPSQTSGGNTNLLGHLLEKYQWKEPNHALIAEVCWLLDDREGYHKQVKSSAVKEKDEKTLRQLKDAAAAKSTGAADTVEKPVTREVVRRKQAQSGKPGFFARP